MVFFNRTACIASGVCKLWHMLCAEHSHACTCIVNSFMAISDCIFQSGSCCTYEIDGNQSAVPDIATFWDLPACFDVPCSAL